MENKNDSNFRSFYGSTSTVNTSGFENTVFDSHRQMPNSVQRDAPVDVNSLMSSMTNSIRDIRLNPISPNSHIAERNDAHYSPYSTSSSTPTQPRFFPLSSPPIPAPRNSVTSPTPQMPPSLTSSLSSLNSAGRHTPQNDSPVLFLAMRRCENEDGSTYLVIVNLKTGERFNEKEQTLRDNHQIGLGDFMRAEKNGNGKLTSIEKTDVSGRPDIKFKVKVEGENALIYCNRARLIRSNNKLIFKSQHFADAVWKNNNCLGVGDYMITLFLLPRPIITGNETYHFEALHPSVFRTANNPGGNGSKPKRNNFYKPKQSNQNINQNQTQQKVTGTGFEAKKPTPNSAGSGNVVVGTGFAPPTTKNNVVTGAGFAKPKTETEKCKAVVMSLQEKENGERVYYLWILDKQAEGRFQSKTHQLDMGHFFEGMFTKSKNDRFECKEYTKGLKQMMKGGIENETIYFEVKVENYQKTINQKYATVRAKWIGEILDIDSKLTKSDENKQVKIQRKGVAEKEYVWAVLEVL